MLLLVFLFSLDFVCLCYFLLIRNSGCWFGVQVDGLDYVGREEELDGPVDQDANFLFEAGKLCEVDAAPHGPREQTGNVHGATWSEWDGEFGAGGLMADDTERTERIEVKRFERAA